jgi:hypothetical protein
MFAQFARCFGNFNGWITRDPRENHTKFSAGPEIAKKAPGS